MATCIKIIFTRHSLTDAQRVGLETAHSMATAAAETIETQEEADLLLDEMCKVADLASRHIEIYGVIPPILRNAFYRASVEKGQAHRWLWVFEAHNVNRASEGQKPQFEFQGWLRTGVFDLGR